MRGPWKSTRAALARLPPGHNRGELRSRSYLGVAGTMAVQSAVDAYPAALRHDSPRLQKHPDNSDQPRGRSLQAGEPSSGQRAQSDSHHRTSPTSAKRTAADTAETQCDYGMHSRACCS